MTLYAIIHLLSNRMVRGDVLSLEQPESKEQGSYGGSKVGVFHSESSEYMEWSPWNSCGKRNNR